MTYDDLMLVFNDLFPEPGIVSVHQLSGALAYIGIDVGGGAHQANVQTIYDAGNRLLATR